MSRVINIDNASKERTRLQRAIVLAFREFAQLNGSSEGVRDLGAFMSLALIAISKTIDSSVVPWEKRGYWIKADRFRSEWGWTETIGRLMMKAVLIEDWDGVASLSAQTAQKLNKITLPKRHNLGTPWVGAWEQLMAREK